MYALHDLFLSFVDSTAVHVRHEVISSSNTVAAPYPVLLTILLEPSINRTPMQNKNELVQLTVKFNLQS